MTMTHEDIEARIVEAAEIERRLPRVGERPDGTKNAWPAYFHTFADQVGWGDAREDRDDRTMVLASVSRDEYDRWQEVRLWVVEMVEEPRYRRALSAWSIAAAGGRPFSVFCRAEGVSRVTGYARKDKAISQIAAKLGLASVSSGLKAILHPLHNPASAGTFGGMMGEVTTGDREPARASDPHHLNRPQDDQWAAEREERRRRRIARLEPFGR